LQEIIFPQKQKSPLLEGMSFLFRRCGDFGSWFQRDSGRLAFQRLIWLLVCSTGFGFGFGFLKEIEKRS
jgi:hypothetical protein